jgi:hypothetical protein
MADATRLPDYQSGRVGNSRVQSENFSPVALRWVAVRQPADIAMLVISGTEICLRLHLTSSADRHVRQAKNKLCCGWLEHTFAADTPTKKT